VHKRLDFAHGWHYSSFAHETLHYSWKKTLGQTALSLAILPKLSIKKIGGLTVVVIIKTKARAWQGSVGQCSKAELKQPMKEETNHNFIIYI